MNENVNENPEQPKYNVVDVVSTNNTIDNVILLLSNVDFELVDFILNKTPDDMKGEINYKILSLFKQLNLDIKSILKG